MGRSRLDAVGQQIDDVEDDNESVDARSKHNRPQSEPLTLLWPTSGAQGPKYPECQERKANSFYPYWPKGIQPGCCNWVGFMKESTA